MFIGKIVIILEWQQLSRETNTQYKEKINVWEGSFIHLFFMSSQIKKFCPQFRDKKLFDDTKISNSYLNSKFTYFPYSSLF